MLYYCICLFLFQFPAHPVEDRTSGFWDRNDAEELARYFSCNDLVICPTCNLLLVDVAELQREHWNAGAFTIPKQQLFDQCKFLL